MMTIWIRNKVNAISKQSTNVFNSTCNQIFQIVEITSYVFAREGKSCRPETKTTINRYVCHDRPFIMKQAA